MANQEKKYKLLMMGILLLLVLIIVVTKINKKPLNLSAITGKENQASPSESIEKNLLVQTDDAAVKKINIQTGEVESVSDLEKEDFSKFRGFPKLGEGNGQDTEQLSVLISANKSAAIVSVVVYDSRVAPKADDPQPILSTSDYLCEIEKKECQKTSLLTQEYQGLDSVLQNNVNSFSWSGFDSDKNILIANLTDVEVGDISPVYVCDVEKKSCEKTEGYDSKKEAEIKAVVPNGFLSPSLQQFVMINQHDQPNQVTGKKWELLLFSTATLSSPIRVYDLTPIIDQDENVAYDSVHSVDWSGDEKKLAIGTSRKIFMLDLNTSALSFAYIAPVNTEGDFYWDSSKLFLSTDAKFIAFVDEGDIIDNSPDNTEQSNENSVDQSNVTYINVLKKIDLENGNKITELMRGPGLSLK